MRYLPSYVLCLFFLAGFTAMQIGCSGYDSNAIHDDDGDGVDAGDAGDDGKVALEPFDPPPLEQLDAEIEWVDQPVLDGLELLRKEQASTEPLASVDEALVLKNDSEEANAKILSALGRLPESDDEVDWEATITRHSGADLKSANPLMISSYIEMEVLDLTGLMLIGFDWNFTPFAQKWAVESWQVSEDRMYDKFVLRDDITWSDGKPLTAHDVAFSFHLIMHPKTSFPAVSTGTDQLRWVHAYDDKTIVIFHKEPQASWTENIQFPIVPKHIYEKSMKEDYTLQKSDYHRKQEDEPVTCGPYEYVKIDRGNEVVLQRRESWHMHQGKQVRAKPFAKEIRIRIIKDPNTWLLALKKGQLDECPLNSEQWQTTATNDDDFYRLNTKATGVEWTEFHFTWNCQTDYFSDKRVRQAMSYAFDHDEMLDKIFYGLYEPANGVFHHTSWMAPKEPLPYYKQDLDKAEDLLDAAGWDDSDGDGVRDKMIDGQLVPFEFTFLCGTTPNSVKLAELLKTNLDQIGIICNVKQTEFTVMMQLNRDHEFDAAAGAWGTGTDPSTLVNIFGTNTGRNYGLYSNLRVDKLFEEGRREFDREKRAAIYAEIHEILYEDQPYTWLFYRNTFNAFSKRLRGYYYSPRGPYGTAPGFLSLWIPVKAD